MKNKVLLIIGAGFSLPANIPIQDAIIDKMIEKVDLKDFMTDPILVKDKSAKFLNCYISVFLFLLKEFYNENVEKLENEYQEIVKKEVWNDEETYEKLLPLKEKVRLSFSTKIKTNVKVSLEDVFTLLDKTINNNSKIGSYYFFLN